MKYYIEVETKWAYSGKRKSVQRMLVESNRTPVVGESSRNSLFVKTVIKVEEMK